MSWDTPSLSASVLLGSLAPPAPLAQVPIVATGGAVEAIISGAAAIPWGEISAIAAPLIGLAILAICRGLHRRLRSRGPPTAPDLVTL